MLGRDMLSRIMVGARPSLIVALLVIILGGLGGTALGIISGYYGGKVDVMLMRTADATLAFPIILAAMLLAIVLGPSMQNVVICYIRNYLVALCSSYPRRGTECEGTRFCSASPGCRCLRAADNVSPHLPQYNAYHAGDANASSWVDHYCGSLLELLGCWHSSPNACLGGHDCQGERVYYDSMVDSLLSWFGLGACLS